MPVNAVVAALILELDAHPLPVAGTHFPHGLAIGKCLSEGGHAEAQPVRQHAEEEDHAQLVHRRVSQSVEIVFATNPI
jgi:hypothetical protein